MAKVKLNPILEQIRGQVGDLVFKRYGDEVVITRKPDMSNIVPSPAQLAHRERFRQATVYGKLVLADPDAKAFYEQAADAKGTPVLALTVADFFNAPSVDEIDLSSYHGQAGDPISVLAHDDFQVQQVQVEMSNGAGNTLESGLAVQTPPASGRWLYTASSEVAPGETVRIAVTAVDRPGGTDMESAEKII